MISMQASNTDTPESAFLIISYSYQYRHWAALYIYTTHQEKTDKTDSF